MANTHPSDANKFFRDYFGFRSQLGTTDLAQEFENVPRQHWEAIGRAAERIGMENYIQYLQAYNRKHPRRNAEVTASRFYYYHVLREDLLLALARWRANEK